MKKIITLIIAIAMMLTSTAVCYGAVDGITKDNYDSYVKPNADAYGYNKGECDTPYLEGEEYFYNEYYDHWNVDKIYDASLIPQKAEAVKKVVKKKTNLQIAKDYAKKHYKGYAIKVVKFNKVPKKRTNKKIVYIEKIKTISKGGKIGRIANTKYCVRYSKKVPKSQVRICYCVYNPHTNYIDDCVFINCHCVK